MSERLELLKKVERRNSLNKLLLQSEFKDIFLDLFMKETLYELMYREGSSRGVIKAINARKDFNDFIYDIIDNGNQAEEQLKGK